VRYRDVGGASAIYPGIAFDNSTASTATRTPMATMVVKDRICAARVIEDDESLPSEGRQTTS